MVTNYCHLSNFFFKMIFDKQSLPQVLVLANFNIMYLFHCVGMNRWPIGTIHSSLIGELSTFMLLNLSLALNYCNCN